MNDEKTRMKEIDNGLRMTGEEREREGAANRNNENKRDGEIYENLQVNYDTFTLRKTNILIAIFFLRYLLQLCLCQYYSFFL